MLDVHPPHAAARSWSDFLIHIATISVGLLIAVGLEQSVEFFHRQHQRHQLEQDLHAEGLRNRAVIENDIKYLRTLAAWQLRVIHAAQDAQTLQGKPAPPYPAAFNTEIRNSGAGLRYVAPSASVWTIAQESNTIALLPREEALLYTRLYRIHELIVGIDFEWRRSYLQFGAIEARFSPDPDAEQPPILSSMSSPQLEQLAVAAAVDRTAANTLRDLLQGFRGANEAILRGARTEDGLIESIYQDQLNLTPAQHR